jgi:hypothetical protein
VLFDLLVDELQKKPVDVYYLVDKRIESDLRKKNLHKITFLKPSLGSRTLFYIRNYLKFRTVFCFSNIQNLDAKLSNLAEVSTLL